MTYFDKVLYLYPDIQGVMYWNTQPDSKPWKDPYDGLVWNNPKIAKPTKAELDAIDNTLVEKEFKSRKEKAEEASQPKNTEVTDLLNSTSKSIEKKIDSLKINLDVAVGNINQNTISTEQLIDTLKDINDGMIAIKGFLQELPGIKKSISEVYEKLSRYEQ